MNISGDSVVPQVCVLVRTPAASEAERRDFDELGEKDFRVL